MCHSDLHKFNRNATSTAYGVDAHCLIIPRVLRQWVIYDTAARPRLCQLQSGPKELSIHQVHPSISRSATLTRGRTYTGEVMQPFLALLYIVQEMCAVTWQQYIFNTPNMVFNAADGCHSVHAMASSTSARCLLVLTWPSLASISAPPDSNSLAVSTSSHQCKAVQPYNVSRMLDNSNRHCHQYAFWTHKNKL